MKPIVRHKKTNVLYQYNGENSFTNLQSGVTGVVTDAAAKKTFAINLEATEILNEYPIVKDAIQALKLKIEI